VITFLPLARSTKGGIPITQGSKIRFFASQGRLVAPILAKFGMEEWTFGITSMPNFAKIGAWMGA